VKELVISSLTLKVIVTYIVQSIANLGLGFDRYIFI
jgi:hypothetical protein